MSFTTRPFNIFDLQNPCVMDIVEQKLEMLVLTDAEEDTACNLSNDAMDAMFDFFQDIQQESANCASKAAAEEFYLSRKDIDDFERDGFVYVRGGVDPETLSAMISRIWGQVSVELQKPNVQNGPFPTTWPNLSVVTKPPHDEYFESLWPNWISRPLRGALDTLIGPNSWDIPKNVGDTIEHWYYPVKFPVPHGEGEKPLPCNVKGEVNKGWHLDLGADFGARTFQEAVSKEGAPHPGMVLLILMSEVKQYGGGTLLLPGSQRMCAERIKELKIQQADVEHKELVDWCNKTVNDMLASKELVMPFEPKEPGQQQLHQMVGMPGDIILMHPWCIHTCYQNFTKTPRMMANSAVRFRPGLFEPWTNNPALPPVARAAMLEPHRREN